jgi:hypothetical protein
MMRWRALAALAAGLAGILALECSAPEPAPDIVAPPAASPQSPAAAPDTALPATLGARLLGRPLFSPDRRPAAAAPPAQVAATDGATDLPRLAGVIVGPERRSAIFADGAGKPSVAGEGASIGRFTVRAIGPGKVTVTSSEGESVLRPWYADAKAPDLVRPPGPPNGRSR